MGMSDNGTHTASPALLGMVLDAAVESGKWYQRGGAYVVRGLLDKQRLIERFGVAQSSIWTIREIESVAGVLFPQNPTLGEVLDALASPPMPPPSGGYGYK